jgi:hypothetical protein
MLVAAPPPWLWRAPIMPPPRCAAVQASGLPFSDLKLSDNQLQEYLRRDIERRKTELVLLSWVGRAYLLAPWAFSVLFPAVFLLEPYEQEAVPCCFEEAPGVFCCTLRESSIVPQKGIPLVLRVDSSGGEDGVRITAAALLGIGCDLRERKPDAGVPLGDLDARALCQRINCDGQSKRTVVRAIVSALTQELGPSSRVDAMLREDRGASKPLVCAADEFRFSPRSELFAREGLNEKWVEKRSGYYFAESRLQAVCFASSSSSSSSSTSSTSDSSTRRETSFTFYYDETEPLNSNDPRLNVNPEVIFSEFMEESNENGPLSGPL